MPIALANQFQMLRARVENSIPKPCALLVSSALAGDGKSVCAQGLAESMAAAGYRTLLVDLDHNNPTLTGLPLVSSLGFNGDRDSLERCLVTDRGTGVTMLSLSDSKLCQTASKESVRQALTFFQANFDSIIIDAATLVNSSVGVLFSGICDAVILTTREGRSVRREDRMILEILDREGGTFFGVVSVNQHIISEFNRKSITRDLRSSLGAAGHRKMDTPMAASRMT